jgi:hypothetical protein
MLDIDALIEPGHGLGGIAIGAAVADIVATAEPLRVIEIPGDDEDPNGVTIHSFGAIRTWSVTGVVVQVGAFEGYHGRTAAGITIGSAIAEISAACGAVAPMGGEGMITIPSVPGIGFETTEWTTVDEPDPAAHVVQIFVHVIDD